MDGHTFPVCALSPPISFSHCRDSLSRCTYSYSTHIWHSPDEFPPWVFTVSFHKADRQVCSKRYRYSVIGICTVFVCWAAHACATSSSSLLVVCCEVSVSWSFRHSTFCLQTYIQSVSAVFLWTIVVLVCKNKGFFWEACSDCSSLGFGMCMLGRQQLGQRTRSYQLCRSLYIGDSYMLT